MIGQIFSSPKGMLAMLAVGAAAIAAVQLLPEVQKLVTPLEAGAVQVSPSEADSSPFTAIFEPRPLPVRESPVVAADDPVTDGNFVFGQPSDAPGAETGEIPVSVTSQDEFGTFTETQVLRPTFAWINVFGDSVSFNGEPVALGSTITAYDPAGTLIGRTIISTAGQYGVMALYMDDPATEVDEGASQGNPITFKINGIEAVVLGPHAPVWTDNGSALFLNLEVNAG